MQKAAIRRLLERETATTPQFMDFCRLLDATLHYEFSLRLNDLKQAYEAFDPDASSCQADLNKPQRTNEASDALFTQFGELLRMCNYRKLAREELEATLHAASEWGVNLHIDFDMFRQLDVYVHNEKIDQHTRSNLWTLYRKQPYQLAVYGRLAVIFELKVDAATSTDHVAPDQIYLKLFKNIPKQDVDMLLPGARVRMTLLDQGKIILPTVTGIGMTSLKLFKGAVLAAAFAGFYGLLGFLALVGGTIGYGVKSFFGYQRTKEKYHLHLTRNLYYQNLANGRSVLFHLLDEAQEQEFQEAVLAYFMLWHRDESTPADELDREVESFLQDRADWTIDFDIEDALAKLRRLKLATNSDDRWSAIPLSQAIAQLDEAWDNYFQGSASSDTDKQPSEPSHQAG